MNHERFNGILGALDIDLRGLIEGKNKGNYATEDDALHNFRVAADDQNITMGQALRGMAAKHKVIVDDMAAGAIEITEKRIQEHAVDLVVYAALLIPILYEMMEEQEVILVPAVHDCDNCSEQDKGYNRAISVLTNYAQHLLNLGHSIGPIEDSVEELRKER